MSSGSSRLVQGIKATLCCQLSALVLSASEVEEVEPRFDGKEVGDMDVAVKIQPLVVYLLKQRK